MPKLNHEMINQLVKVKHPTEIKLRVSK